MITIQLYAIYIMCPTIMKTYNRKDLVCIISLGMCNNIAKMSAHKTT